MGQSLLSASTNRGLNARHVTLGKRPVLGFVHFSVTCTMYQVFFLRRVLQATNGDEASTC